MIKKIAFCLCSLIFLGSCDNEDKETFDLLILNAAVVDVQSGSIIPKRLIAISNDTIRRVDEMSNRDNYESREQLDIENKFIMPGLWDMHVHFRGGDSLISENKDLLPLFLAYGITTIRDAGGDITPAVLNWRNQIQDNELDGPTIFTSGPKLDGANPAWPGSISVTGKEEVENALDSLHLLNVDYVKIYDGSLTEDAFYSIIKAAEKRDMKTTGHMPLSADFRKAVELGLDGSEHMYYVLKASSPLADSLAKLDLGYGMMGQIIDSYDPELAEQVFTEMKNNEVSLTPTLHISKTLGEILDVDHSQDSLLSMIGSGIRQTYQGRIEGAKRARERGTNMRGEMEQLVLDMIVPMYNSGVNLLAGSDSGAFNSFVYPGQSLHGELKRLVAAGLSPQQALTTSVINGPKFFDLQDFYGSIEKGNVADLIVLEDNPLEEIDFANDIDAVIKSGNIYDKHALNSMLEKLKK
ncbi:MAG TPA: amidohydrolase family protein [Salinimicrobium sp.]|nr:amidohydrolase family protein [Salinimicrobium sp.]